jgi:hypothetical protein
MRLTVLSLETAYFEDYLSFLTEVLELELHEMTEISMRLDFEGTWLEIKKIPSASYQVASNLEFGLEAEEYEALRKKVSFFYYRRGACRFLYLSSDEFSCDVVDPDGRLWRFKNISLYTQHTLPNESSSVRNY